jgi:hypothetical protein
VLGSGSGTIVLHSLDVCTCESSAEYRIFRESFESSTSEGRSLDIECWSEDDVNVFRLGFVCEMMSDFCSKVVIPCGSDTEGAWKGVGRRTVCGPVRTSAVLLESCRPDYDTDLIPRTPFGPSENRKVGTPLSGIPAVCHISTPPRRAILSGYVGSAKRHESRNKQNSLDLRSGEQHRRRTSAVAACHDRWACQLWSCRENVGGLGSRDDSSQSSTRRRGDRAGRHVCFEFISHV